MDLSDINSIQDKLHELGDDVKMIDYMIDNDIVDSESFEYAEIKTDEIDYDRPDTKVDRKRKIEEYNKTIYNYRDELSTIIDQRPQRLRPKTIIVSELDGSSSSFDWPGQRLNFMKELFEIDSVYSQDASAVSVIMINDLKSRTLHIEIWTNLDLVNQVRTDYKTRN
jgi:hypothetical protein